MNAMRDDLVRAMELAEKQVQLLKGALAKLDQADALLDGRGAQPSIPFPVVEPPGSAPTFRSGQVPTEVWILADEVAPTVGLTAEVLVAIEVWETAWYTSRLWRQGLNPGGMKDNPALDRLGFTYGTYEAADGNVYETFPDWKTGVRSHAAFFSQKRYDGVRSATKPAGKLLAIHEAGYAEHSQEWLDGTMGLLDRFLKGRS